ncbi:T9SS type A sorting domain-containing protein [bacterium]|nr:T9SS type A sorting domain-containing protein [bacterium]
MKILGFSRVVVEFILAGFLLVLLALFSTAQAANFTVTNVSEFQTALNTAAANGENDTITVMAGTYNVSSTITFWSDEEYSILIRGDGSPIFDGGDTTQIMNLITVSNNGDMSIEGLIIQHGEADYGGGLYIETQDADISLNNCTIDDNTAGYVCGGVNIYSITGNITITNCMFRRNSSPNPSGYPYGTAGGLFVQTEGEETEIRVIECTFAENTAERDGAGAMLYPMGDGSTVVVENSTFNNNIADEFGGGCWIRCPAGNAIVEYRHNTLTGNSSVEAGSGGGTYIQIASGTIDLLDNTHIGNSSVWQGGGLWIEHGGGTLNIQNNRFTRNTSGQTGGGANIFLDNGTVTIDHNVFNENESSAESGGGLCISTTTGNLNIFNNTFYSNSASEGGGIYFYFDQSEAQANVLNNILWHDTPPAIAYSGAQTVTARYSDIEGGTGQPWFGTGCIDEDPLFVDPVSGDFHLTWANFPVPDSTKSPCIDAGDTASPFDPDSTVADMGAFYFDQMATGIEEDYSDDYPDVTTNSVRLYQNYPNPFNSATTIRYSISKSCNVKIQIYNVSGQLVETLVNDYKVAGDYGVVWNSKEISSGIYFYRLDIGNYRATKKLILMK